MTATYPATVKGFTTLVDYTDTVLALQVNSLQDEVSAVEGYIGTMPHVGSGWIGTFDQVTTTWTNLKSRISNIEYGITAVIAQALPTGGTTSQVLQKTSNADYAVGWVTITPVTSLPGTSLTGTTLASGITASSLTSFGASPVLGTPASVNLINATGFPNGAVGGYTVTATSAVTTSLLAASTDLQDFNGTTAGQIIQMPAVTTLLLGRSFSIQNKSTQVITVNSSGGNLITTIPAGVTIRFFCAAITGTTASSWVYDISGFSAIPGLVANSIAATQAIVAGNAYYVTTSSAWTLTLPASATVDDKMEIWDVSNTAATNNITVNSNGLKINGSVQNLTINVNSFRCFLRYLGSTIGWQVY